MPFSTPWVTGSKPLVMVVDDQATGRLVLSRLIGGIDPDVQVVAYSDALSAMGFIRQATPDLIVTDYLMPTIDGIGLIRRVRAMPGCEDVPIIVVTVSEDKRVRYEALEAGATDFLTRPVDPLECRTRCRNLLTLRRQQLLLSKRASWLEEEIALATTAIAEREQETLLRLARAGEYRDEQTGDHVARIAEYCLETATALALPTTECEAIRLASPMHDIGKIGIPDNILRKPGRLTDAEQALMREHTRIGYEMLHDSPSHYLQLGASIALHHHEKVDGSGYPQGLQGGQIPIAARIVAVADVFDALTSSRPYKPAWPVADAVAYLEAGTGSHFDRDCVRAFLQCMPRFERVRTSYPSGAGEVDGLA